MNLISSLHIDTERTWRGGEQQALYLTKGLKARGHPVTVVAQPGSPFAQRAGEAGLSVVEIAMRGEADLAAVLKLRTLIKGRDVDIVHMHTSHAHTLGCAAARMARRGKTVVARRVDFSVRKHRLSIYKYLWGVDRYVAVCHAIRRVLINDGVPGDKIGVVHSGIELETFLGAEPKDLRPEFGVPADVPVIGNVAFMADHKGQRYFVEAVPAILEKVPDARFFVVGDGELRDDLERLSATLGIGERLIFPGFRTDVPQFLQMFDVFVMSSHMDGLCNAVLQAMAMDVPVVGTDAGGIPEMVNDGKTGLLVPPRNPEAIAEAVLRLLNDQDLGGKLVSNARSLFDDDFTVDAMVEGNLRVYHALLRGKKV